MLNASNRGPRHARFSRVGVGMRSRKRGKALSESQSAVGATQPSYFSILRHSHERETHERETRMRFQGNATARTTTIQAPPGAPAG